MMIILLLAIPSVLSYYSSYKLYHGFKHTKAKTYDECMNNVLGPRLGYISNIAIFIHTFSSVVSAWIFSYKVLINSLLRIFDIKTTIEYILIFNQKISLILVVASGEWHQFLQILPSKLLLLIQYFENKIFMFFFNKISEGLNDS